MYTILLFASCCWLLAASSSISVFVNHMILGVVVAALPRKFPLSISPSIFLFMVSLAIFLFLKLCWIIHPVIHTFLFLGISFSFPVTLSSDFCLTEQVSKITTSASSMLSVYVCPLLVRTAFILALSE